MVLCSSGQDDQATLINASNVAVMNAKAGGGASDSELANDSHMFTPKKKTLPKLVKVRGDIRAVSIHVAFQLCG